MPVTKGTRDDREAQLATTWLPQGCALGRTWLDAARAVSEASQVSLGDMLSLERRPRLVRARARAWAALLDLHYSYPEIAAWWFVHHTTVMLVVSVHEPEAAARCSARHKMPGLAKVRARTAKRLACAGASA